MPERLRVVERLFHAALELPPDQRAAYLTAWCVGDARLRDEVESLLAHAGHSTDAFDRDVAQQAVRVTMTPTPPPTLAPGTCLNAYRIERVLGQGGMGVVYLATDTRLHRLVAIKTLGGTLVQTPDAEEQLLGEARAAAALAHPNIAGLFDCGATDGMPWFVMEYVTGVTLRTVLQRGSLPDDSLLSVATQIAAGLEYAHARHVVHRDLKPENVLLTDDGVVKIIDFGLASVAQVRSDAGASQPLRGTPRYMAPEVWSGQPEMPAADVYSAGVLLFEMATGTHPGLGPDEVGRSVADDAEAVLPPSRRRWAGVIRRCLAVDLAIRYRDGAELAAAIAGVAAAPVTVDVSARPRLMVLDFTNVTGEEGWLGGAVADTVAADLSRLAGVSVATRHGGTPRRSAEAAGSLNETLLVAREQGARWVVTGTYQQSGRRIRVTPSLVDVLTAAVRPVGKVDGDVDAVFDLQDEVVELVMQGLGLSRASGADGAAPVTTNPLAFEHCARGRQRLYRMDVASLSEAVTHFTQAVTLDPTYALAYSGLGTAHSLRFLRSSNPDDVAQASASLERATQLDPSLGEPYPWLVNIRFRQNDPLGALDAAEKGVTLEPDLPEAQYFGGGLHYMLAEHPRCDVAVAVERLAEAIRLQPLFHPAWIVLGATATFLGQLDAADRILTHAMTLEAEPALAYRFVGASSLRGLTLVRRGHWTPAIATLQAALEELEPSQHVYRDTFRALACCGMGDAALRTGAADEALAHFHQARRIVKDAARLAGSVRLLIRADAGLAAAAAATGDPARAADLIDQAASQLDSAAAHTGTITFDCGLGQLCLALAVAECRLQRLDRAASLIARAERAGWRDASWLRLDPELRPLADHPIYRRVVETLTARPCPVVRVPPLPGRRAEAPTRE